MDKILGQNYCDSSYEFQKSVLDINTTTLFYQNISEYVLGKVIKFLAKQKGSFKANISFIQRTPLPNPCWVKIKNGTQSKQREIDRLLTNSFAQNFKERYHHKRKKSQGSNPKNCLPEEAP